MRLSEIARHLKLFSLTARQIAGFNRAISRGTSYAERLTAQERAILIRLLREEEFLPGMAHVITEKAASPEPAAAGEALPSLLFAVLAPDWAGLADACLGTVHEAGLNIAYTHGFILRKGHDKLGVVLMEVEITPSLSRAALDIARAKIQQRLSRIAAEDEAKKTLQRQEARRLYAYTTVTDLLKKRVSTADLKEIMGDSGEAIKFFIARQDSYISERAPDSIAGQVLVNYELKKRIRSGASTLEIAAQTIKYLNKAITGISVITREPNVTFERLLRLFEELVPGGRRYSDYAYYTADKIAVFHLEVTDRGDRALSDKDAAELSAAVRTLPAARETLGPTPGVELVRRKIVPLMLDEEKELKIPQGYIHPHAPDHFKLIAVASGKDAGHGLEIVSALSGVPGFTAAMPDKPSAISYRRDEEERTQEIAIVDLWIDRRALFGADCQLWNDEEIYNKIEQAVKTIPGFGPKLRIFDRTSRMMRQMRLKAVLGISKSGNIPADELKNLFYNLGDRCLLDPENSDSSVYAQIKLWYQARQEIDPARNLSFKFDAIRAHPEDPGFTALALAFAADPARLQRVLDTVKKFEVNSFCRTNVDALTLALFNLTCDGKPLLPGALAKLSSLLNTI
ncbi:MAG: hypothetical protein QME74_08345 [Candidatus Edwardsbacteria bacterium]|nr:hypothetical protein [Candidatus Edwardsbacteria bacterium]